MTLVFLLLVDIATFSRSGGVGLIAGALVLVIPYRRFFRSKQFLYPLGGLAIVLLGVLYVRSTSSRRFLSQRVSTNGRSTNAHFAVYSSSARSSPASAARARDRTTSPSTTSSSPGRRTTAPTRTGSPSIVESGLIGLVALDRLPPLRLPAASRGRGACGRLLDRIGDPAGCACAAARVRDDGGPRRDDRRQLLLPHDAVLLLLRVPGLRARSVRGVRRPRARAPPRRCGSSSSRRRGRGRSGSSQAASSPTPSSGCASAGWRWRCSRPGRATATTGLRTAAGWRRTCGGGRGGAAHAPLDVAGRAARGARGRPRPRALAAHGGGRALRREAVRRHAARLRLRRPLLGRGARARAAGPRALAPASGRRRDLRLRDARRGRARRGARGRGDPERRADPRRGRARRPSRPRCSTSAGSRRRRTSTRSSRRSAT